MSQAMRKITGNIGKSGCMIFLNQLRLKIGVTYGNLKPPLVCALKFYASVRLDIRRIQTLKREPGVRHPGQGQGGQKQGGPSVPHRKFDILFGQGISTPAVCSTSPKKPVSSPVKVPGTATRATTSARVVTTRSVGWSRTLRPRRPLKCWCVRS